MNGSSPMPPLVMLLDDDADISEMYRLGLEAAGLRVIVAADPAGFFDALATQVPDAVVLDWRLPGMDGSEVLQQLRVEPRTAKLPVFFLSGYFPDHDGGIDRVFALGALAWLRKSLTPPDALARRLTQAIGKTRYGRRAEDND